MPPLTLHEIYDKLELLRRAVDSADDKAAREVLHRTVPTFLTPEEVNRIAETSEEMKEVSPH